MGYSVSLVLLYEMFWNPFQTIFNIERRILQMDFTVWKCTSFGSKIAKPSSDENEILPEHISYCHHNFIKCLIHVNQRNEKSKNGKNERLRTKNRSNLQEEVNRRKNKRIWIMHQEEAKLSKYQNAVKNPKQRLLFSQTKNQTETVFPANN